MKDVMDTIRIGLEYIARENGRVPKNELLMRFEDIYRSGKYPDLPKPISGSTLNKICGYFLREKSKYPRPSDKSLRIVMRYLEIILFDWDNSLYEVKNFLYYRNVMRETGAIASVPASRVIQAIARHPTFSNPIWDKKNLLDGVIVNSPLMIRLLHKYGRKTIKSILTEHGQAEIVLVIPKWDEDDARKYAESFSVKDRPGRPLIDEDRLLVYLDSLRDMAYSLAEEERIRVEEIWLNAFAFRLTGMVPVYRSLKGFSFGTTQRLSRVMEEGDSVKCDVIIYDNERAGISELKRRFMR